jgi:hypothetical protein
VETPCYGTSVRPTNVILELLREFIHGKTNGEDVWEAENDKTVQMLRANKRQSQQTTVELQRIGIEGKPISWEELLGTEKRR